MILLYSGGIDSWIAWHHLGQPDTLYVRLNHRYQDQELRSIQYSADNFGGPRPHVFEGPDLSTFERLDGHIPNRNAFLVLCASMFSSDQIALVCQDGEDTISDRDLGFFNRSELLMSHLSGKSVRISSVFPTHTKCEMVDLYLKSGGDPRALIHCYSCTNPLRSSVIGCGRCSACFRKWICLEYNRVSSYRSCFDQAPWGWEGVDGYRQRCLSGHYGIKRGKEILEVLGRFDV